MSNKEISAELINEIKTLKPSVAQQLLQIVEREQKHRHEVEVNVRAAELRDMKRGQIFAFIIVMFFGTVGTLLIYSGHDIAGGLFGGSAILGIVTTFIAGRQRSLVNGSKLQKTSA